jgi:hypothetical protein
VTDKAIQPARAFDVNAFLAAAGVAGREANFKIQDTPERSKVFTLP